MKTLIIYSTKHGTAEKAANILKSKLIGEVHTVNIMQEPVTSIEDYDTIILGGSIYIGKIQKKLSSFVNINLPLLIERKTGLFICAGEEDEVLKEKEFVLAFPPALFDHAIGKEVFGFEFDMNKLSFFEKLIMGKVKGIKTSINKLSEEKIYAFAEIMVRDNGVHK